MAKKILFVDDEPDVMRVALFRLKKAGYEVTTAVNGQEALDLVQQIIPDLLLIDIRIPIFTGLEVCKKVKSDEKLKHIPVILFTASVQDMDTKVKEVGADGYLLKPFNPEQLLEKVKNFLGANK
jgi:CheY-like chemotaxis protein